MIIFGETNFVEVGKSTKSMKFVVIHIQPVVRQTCSNQLYCTFVEFVKPTEQALDNHIVYKGCAVDRGEIGIELGLKSEVLDIIKANHEFHSEKYTKCFQQMLHKWLQSKPNATWKELEVALANVTRQNTTCLQSLIYMVRKMLAKNPYHITNKTTTVQLQLTIQIASCSYNFNPFMAMQLCSHNTIKHLPLRLKRLMKQSNVASCIKLCPLSCQFCSQLVITQLPNQLTS